jgi:sugar (pentulose or hexulose) kinase
MEKTFAIIIVAVAIIGFSLSAYLFSGSEISIKSPISIETQSNNPVMDEIEQCIEQNLAGGSVTLNSFNANMLLTLKEAASKVQSDRELNEIRDRLHTLTDCKPNNQGFTP